MSGTNHAGTPCRKPSSGKQASRSTSHTGRKKPNFSNSRRRSFRAASSCSSAVTSRSPFTNKRKFPSLSLPPPEECFVPADSTPEECFVPADFTPYPASKKQEINLETAGRDEVMAAVEAILGYEFSNRKLLEAALTHPSYEGAESYQVLEFLGDSVVGHLISVHVFGTYAAEGYDEGQLSVLRAANVSTEKLARVAAKLGLYGFVRRNSPSLDEKVEKYIAAIQHDDLIASRKPPKVLADIFESVVAAIYVDCGYSLDKLWMVCRELMMPIVTPETLQNHPSTQLIELCQREGKELKFKMKLDKRGINVIHAYVNGTDYGFGADESKEIAKAAASRKALEKLEVENKNVFPVERIMASLLESDMVVEEDAKHKLTILCSKMHWCSPVFKAVSAEGPSHGRKFIYSVEVRTPAKAWIVDGEARPRVKSAENSAACRMLCHLRSSGCVIN